MTVFRFNAGLAVSLPALALVRMRESGQISRPAAWLNARRMRQTRGQAIA
ncbi:MAG TPA: hypothetical protein VHA35_04730 [Dongiaceae bacterium]|jgi:hypothetical protein|nr:hypothetical protein [Dongiaceae bacterium]